MEAILDGFEKVNQVIINNKPWFVAEEVATAVGHPTEMLSDAVAVWVDDEDKRVIEVNTDNGKHNVTVINESGLCSLFLSGKFSAFKSFKHWITSSVIPSVANNDGYILGQEELSSGELVERALLVAHKIAENKSV